MMLIELRNSNMTLIRGQRMDDIPDGTAVGHVVIRSLLVWVV
jgi:hypothetical protein